MAHGLEPEYVLVCSTRTPIISSPPTITEIGEFSPIGPVSYADELNFEGEASFSVEPENVDDDIAPKLLDLKANPMELTIYRNGVFAWKGPIISAQLQGPTLTINARGLLYYLRYMGLENDLSFDADVFTIARQLPFFYQVYDWGNYGIDTSTDTTLLGLQIVRRYPFENRNIVFNRVEELADIYDFNFWIDVDRVMRVASSRGTDKTLTFHADEQNIINANCFWSVSAERFGSGAAAIGLKDGAPSVNAISHDSGTMSTFGRSTSSISTHEDVTSQSTIDAHAAATRDERKDQVFAPGPQVGTLEGGEPTDIEPGDTISYDFKVGKLGKIVVQRRIQMMRTTLHEDGQETMELAFT